MKVAANSPEEYIEKIPDNHKPAISKLRRVITNNLPAGFQENMSYGMIGYIVPHTLYPMGYHCSPQLPLPFINIASQKNFIAVYHMGIYLNTELLAWFKTEYPKHSNLKLDMGKSCIRFKNPDKIPFELIGELASKLTVEEWIELYEKQIKR
tara:strand:- start:817 stop:1272 length:456 start_codon:yes stop_codon:yes gene_type:complete